jgi:N-acetylneuraminate synthase
MPGKIRSVRIGERVVGEGHPCFIVAEAGSNHNGSLEQALAMIDVAKAANVDAVKFQNFRAEKLYPKNAGISDYLPIKKPIYDIIKGMEMPLEWIPTLADYCKTKDLMFFSAPFDEESADALDPYVEVFKIASYEITHMPLIRHVARKKKPMILSTGTANLKEVEQAVEWCRAEGNEDLVLLQCTASYPVPLASLNVRALVTMRETFGVPTGLSDHSRDPFAGPMTAVALGANVIEKHFTLSNHLPGPDHTYAVEPDELAELVRRVRQVEAVLGNGLKETLPVEAELHSFARRSIFALRDIQPGEQFAPDNIGVLRCGKLGFGMAPEHYPALLKRRAAKLIPRESLVTFNDAE